MVNGTWQVQFPHGLGAPPTIQLDKLLSLHRHPDFGVRHFSGTASYRTTFQFTGNRSGNSPVLLDLGRVEVLAEVELNGKKAGTVWKEPFHLDITKLLQKGTNHLTVKVTNLWPNRMIGDAHLPPENGYDENGFVTRLPGWYVNNQPKPGERLTFAVWNPFKKEDALLESGLLGPVRLLIGVEKIL
jgi:hypothetical protein